MTEFLHKRTWGPIPRYPGVLGAAANPSAPFILAGPCSIEDEEQMIATANVLREFNGRGTIFARGGIYRAGTYPPERPGINLELLKLWKEITRNRGLDIVVEVVDLRYLPDILFLLGPDDALQVGARQMQNYGLLREVATEKRTVFLKRNMGATLDEFLGAAEYLVRGKASPVLIERGSSTHMNHVRWDLSISAIAAIKTMTKLPVIVDASHGTGRRDLVEPMTLAGIAAGADGFLLEMHPRPQESLSDADQAAPLTALGRILERAELVRAAVAA